MSSTGRGPKGYLSRNVGASHGMAKLTEADVRRIRATYERTEHLPRNHPGKVSVAALARELGVSDYVVHSVIKGRTWTHVK